MDAKSLTGNGLIAVFCSDLPENNKFPEDGGPVEAINGRPNFENVLRLYHKKVYNLAYRLLGNPDEAADLTQESFVKAYKAYKWFHGEPESVYPWLCRITVNGCKNKFKEMNRRRQHEAISLDEQIGEEDSGITLEPGDESMNPADMFERHELESKIQEAIQSLPPEFRVVVVLRDMQGLSYQEIVDSTELTMETVKIRLFRGREMLRRKLSPYVRG